MLIGFAKVTRDLTERRMAEEALRVSEERFRLLVQSVTDYAIYMLDPVGTVTSWNAGAQRFKGYTADEIMGENFSRFYSDEDRLAGVPVRALETAAREGRFEAEGWRIRKDGSRFWASVVIDPIRNMMGDLVGFAKVTRDLTERREAQLALEEAREAIFQSQKMDAIGKLTGGVAHDFNNLLAVIVGSLDLAKQRLATGGDVSRYIQNAMTAAERGATLTQRMLAFARKQELRLGRVDCVALVRNMAALLETTLGSTVTIETRFPLSLSCAHADPAQLELALVNLAVNARDAMPDGGRLVVATRPEPGPTALGRVCIEVRDTGTGMSEEVRSRVFEPFFTTKEVGKGSGLGLSQVYGFVRQSEGEVRLESAPGEGTMFQLLLPASSARAEAPRREMAPKDVVGGAERILLVEDDPTVLALTFDVLGGLGYQVQTATHAAEALERLKADPTIDLLFTDVVMPGGVSGLSLARSARELRPELRVLLTSGFVGETRVGEDCEFVLLDKPYEAAQLALTLRKLLDRPADRPPRRAAVAAR